MEFTALAPLSKRNPQDAINAYLQGKTTQDIANEYGVHRSAIHQWLIRTIPGDWQASQASLALTRYDDALKAVDDADDGLLLARAREQLKSAQWILERTCRSIYGAAPTVAIQINEYQARPTEDLLAELRSLLDK